MADANRHSAHIEYIKPNTRIRMKRQKVPDDEDIDIDKIVKDDMPRHDRKRATEIERQSKEKEVHDPGSCNCAVFVLYTVSIVPSFTSRV